MKFPEWLEGESLTRLLQGVALGAAATMIIGFNWGAGCSVARRRF